MGVGAVKAVMALRGAGIEKEERSCAAVNLFWSRVKENVDVKFGSVWSEMSGSIGDLGTFVPLLLTLAFVNGVDLGTTLIFTGSYNIITGVLFGIPMPVQPMKYIFAAAIADGEDPMTVPQIMAAGLCTAMALLLCGATGLMNVATRLVPSPVIRGFQLSQGITFGITAIKYIARKQDMTTGKEFGTRDWLGTDGIVLALCALAFVVLVSGPGDDTVKPSVMKAPPQGIGEEGTVHGGDPLTESLLHVREAVTVPEGDVEDGKQLGSQREVKRLVIPSALIAFLVGLVLALVRDPSGIRDIQLGATLPTIVRIS